MLCLPLSYPPDVPEYFSYYILFIILSLQPTPVLTEEIVKELAIVVGLSATVGLLLTLGIIVVILCVKRRRTTRKKKAATNVAHQSSSSQLAATTHELRRVSLPLPPTSIPGLQNYTPTPNNNTLSLRGTENVAYGAHVSQGSGPDSDGYDYPFVTP